MWAVLLGIVAWGITGAAPDSIRDRAPVLSRLGDDTGVPVAKWLALSYVETDSSAGFGAIDESAFEPCLYTTFAAARIHAASGKERLPSGTADWVHRLVTGSGAYDDPIADAPALLETFWALVVLRSVGKDPRAPDDVLAFVETCREASGWYTLDCGHHPIPSKSIGEKVTATYFAHRVINLLTGITEPPAQQWATKAINRYLHLRLADGGASLADRDAGYVMMAILALVYGDGSPVSGTAREWVEHRLAEASQLKGTWPTVMRVNRLLALEQHLTIQLPEKTDRRLRHWIEQRGLPAVRFVGNRIDAVQAYHGVELAQRVERNHPDWPQIEAAFTTHRMNEGYAQLTHFPISLQATVYALALRRDIGDEATGELVVDEPLLRRTLQQVMTSKQTIADAETEIERIVLATRAYRYLRGELSTALRQQVAARLGELGGAARRIGPVHNRWQAAARLAEGVVLLAESPSTDLIDFLKVALQQMTAAAKQGNVSMRQIYDIATIERCIGGGDASVKQSEIWRKALDRFRIDGAFKRSPDSPVADLEATRLAVNLRRQWGPLPPSEWAKLRAFVRSCRTPNGFAYLSGDPSMPWKDRPDGGANLRTTWLALSLLDLLDHSS